jgi:hypothetical protein
MAAPPAGQDVVVAGCESASEGGGCPWKIFFSVAAQSHRPSIRVDRTGAFCRQSDEEILKRPGYLGHHRRNNFPPHLTHL